MVQLAKTSASRRQVPLSPRTLAALDAMAIEASGVARPARMYDLRSTFTSNSLAAGIDVFELARVMGTSIEMIERHHGTLLTGAAAGIASRLATFEAEQGRSADQATEDV